MVGIKDQEFFYSSFPRVHNWGEDYLSQFQGFWFLPSFIHGSKPVVDLFQPLSTDVILASSPKMGTTWLKSLLYSIVNRPSKSQLLTTSHPHEIVPSLELQVYGEPLSDSSPPRFPSNTASSTRLLSTHLPIPIPVKADFL
ncbi:cytosolic sulfotransferase 10-like [Rhododendron vialii]|uniref:cytosolic sulfotransferase 10-like n=1 Tax=Rhododendron vialii TaxID=182163 RepID=UPI0026602ED8|nr:cytosolic sulfotransferase 10-like [Rhododendron vialii]